MNRFFTLLLAASSLTAVGQVPEYVPTDGLIGWWPLDGSGEDLSFFGNDAEIFGSPTATTNRFGTSNSALLFDGASDRLISEGFARLVGNMPFTVSFWWKVDTADAGGVMVSYGNTESCTENFYIESLNAECDEIEGSGLYSNSCLGRRTDFSSYNDNSWHHCAFVHDGMGTNFAQMWLDGELYDLFVCAQSEENEILSLEPDATGLTIGERSDGNGNYKGSLDDLFIWNRTLNSSEINELVQSSELFFGCTQINACNYDAEANHDDGSCDLYTCKCLDGTVWNAELGGCISANTADINNDGCVQLNDLLDLLSAYGDCGAQESPWQCGDPLEYQGYDYETVQIGEQCWFAENLRAESYTSGDLIPSSLSQLQWSSATAGALDNYGLRQGAECQDYADDPNYDIQTCNPEEALLEYGLLYNAFAMLDSRGLCPTGWIVPSDEEWNELEIFLGMDPALAFQTGWRGTEHGAQLRSTYGWRNGANGSDDFGFSVVAGGLTSNGGSYSYAGRNGQFWSTSQREDGEAYWYIRDFRSGLGSVSRFDLDAKTGLSVRCIKDAE